jgi:acetoacetate decarboxylase
LYDKIDQRRDERQKKQVAVSRGLGRESVMGFVKTPEEVARIEKVASHPRFVGSEMLTIDFLTTPEFVASVLPPGLEPATEPLVTAMVGRWRSNCVGDYAGGAIYLMARHKTIEAP